MFYKKSKKKSDYVSQASNEAFKQLASNNVKKSMKDYLIYFITLVFGVALLYTFNSLDDNLALLSGNNMLEAYINMSRGIVAGFSVLICIIFGFLITYANNFLMKKRKKEFGIYTTLGMDKRDISKLMFKETTIIGMYSLITGLILGLFASQGLSIITLKMLGLGSSTFRFSVSIAAIIKTVIFFGLVLLLVNKFNKKTIEKNTLIELLNSSNKNEFSIGNTKKSNIAIFFLSIGLMMASYLILLSSGKNNLPSASVISICLILITLGIYLFFISVSDFVILKIKKHKNKYYNNLNIFIVSQISSRIKTMSMSITVICLLLFSSMIIMPFGMSIGKYLISDIKEATPYDVSISNYIKDKYGEGIQSSSVKNDTSMKNPSIKDTLIKNEFPLNDFASNTSELNMYSLENIKISDFIADNKDKLDSDNQLYIVSLGDYNASRKQRGLNEIKLKNNEFAINCTVDSLKPIYEKYIKSQPKSLEVNGTKLNLNQSSLYTNSYDTNIAPTDDGTLIVPDAVVSNLNPVKTILNINYKKADSETENKFVHAYMDYRDKYNDNDYFMDLKQVIDGEKISLNTAFSFISVYMGVILLISAGAILALQQLTESTINKQRFELLRKLGVSERDMKKAIFIQVFILFAIPLVLALVNAMFISKVLFVIMVELSGVGVIKNLLATVAIVFVIYGIYFFSSYFESLNIINDKK